MQVPEGWGSVASPSSFVGDVAIAPTHLAAFLVQILFFARLVSLVMTIELRFTSGHRVARFVGGELLVVGSVMAFSQSGEFW
jgi:hypothetical protein